MDYGGAMRPNIFNYATSEFSQDAFFCWLLEWSKEEYVGEKLNTISLDFINYILENTNKDKIDAVNKIEIIRQFKQEARIDFLVKINNAIVIVFEDKIDTQHHDNQLIKYRQYIENDKEYKNYQISYVYLKSDIVFSWEKWSVETAGYLLIDLFTLVELLEKGNMSEIYGDYIQWLYDKEEKYLAYTGKNIDIWKHEDWLGFIYHINCKIEGSNFGEHYKGDNWWLKLSEKYDNENKDCCVSLEINKTRCVIKVVFEDDSRDKIEYRKQILEDIHKFLNQDSITPASSYGGKTMTIAYVNEYLVSDNGIIRLKETEDRIKDIVGRFNDYYDEIQCI
jgi:hypothetical protein